MYGASLITALRHCTWRQAYKAWIEERTKGGGRKAETGFLETGTGQLFHLALEVWKKG
jgi:hypothetical protein